jgi:Cdc6-like AAA superfamily ATPase
MIKYQERLEKLATATHIHEFRKAISEQQRMNAAVLKAQDLKHQRDIITWLAPATYDVDYCVDDLMNAGAARHVSTCRWVLAKDVFLHFSLRVLQEGSLLWIYAQPDAGKTVLSAFLIDYFSNNQHSRLAPVLYFFCRNTDAEKNKPITVLRSLSYQLFQALRKRSMSSFMQKDLTSAIVESGQKKSTKFDKIWQIFFNHIANLASATIIVDALDECEDPSTLVKNFQSMTNSCHVSVILISRKEAYLYQLPHQSDLLEIMAEDVDADIKAFIEAKINESSCLSHPSVRDLVMKRLCESHKGMFLWVYLMWKELKSCISVHALQ